MSGMEDVCKNYFQVECDQWHEDYCFQTCKNLEFTRPERRVRALEDVNSELSQIRHALESLLDEFRILAKPAREKERAEMQARIAERITREREELVKKVKSYEYISLSYVCKLLGKSTSYILKQVREGKIKRYEVSGENCLGQGRMYKKDDMIRFHDNPELLASDGTD